jgi:sugar phosphate isomerase/epimerase
VRLAVSNIAWPAEQDPAIADALARAGVAEVEIAPTRVWPRPLEATDREIDAHRQFWECRGIRVVAMQALLYEHPEWRILQDSGHRATAHDYLTGIIRIAGRLGATALVFGSPKNRLATGLEPGRAWSLAVGFFGRLAAVARRHGTVLCIEPNPPEYGCDFVTTAAEGGSLARAVGDEGFGLHLDAAGMHLAGEGPAAAFAAARPWWRHFHLSEPFLGPLGQGGVGHAALADAVRASGYAGGLSIEMKPAADGNAVAHVERAVLFARRVYGAGAVAGGAA